MCKSIAGVRALSVAMPLQYANTLESFLKDIGIEYVEENDPCYGEREFHLIDNYNRKDLQAVFELCQLLEKRCI